MVRLGIDVGSTTVKLVLLDDDNNIVYSKYERHMSNVFEKAGELIKELRGLKGNISVKPVIAAAVSDKLHNAIIRIINPQGIILDVLRMP